MTVSAGPLAAELKAARRGRGLYHAEIAGRLGPAMRATFGILESDQPADARRKAIKRVQEASAGLPDELSLAVLGALGIHRDVRDMMLLQDRIGWLATRLRRDTRTARRRVDEACDRLAEILVSADSRPGRLTSGDWHVRSYHAVVLLDAGPAESIERRVVVAERDGIDQLVLPWSLPRLTEDQARHDMHVRVIYGGVLTRKERDSGSRFRLVLRLPRPLRAGESHEYGLVIRVPEAQPMRSHYVYVPATRCDFFDLRVRFPLDAPPQRVWRISAAFHRDLDEGRLDTDLITVDRSGDVHLQFDEIDPGYGYGVQWAGPAAPDGRPDHPR